MEDNNELVTDVTENVEQTTEEIVESVETTEEVVETPKTYTEEELNKRVDELLAKKIARKEAKIRKEYEEKYSDYKEAELVLNTGLGTSSIKEATENLREFYTKKKGIDIPKYEPSYSENDMKVLANAEAQSIIDAGYDEVVEKVDRLAEIGVDNMTPRQKETFRKLAEYRQNEENIKELAKIGVGEKALQDNDFIEFANKLNPSLSIKEKYEMYSNFKPKPKVEPIGSMKGTKSEDSAVKDFYSYEEAMKFTKADFDKNPELFKAVEKSMSKWK